MKKIVKQIFFVLVLVFSFIMLSACGLVNLRELGSDSDKTKLASTSTVTEVTRNIEDTKDTEDNETQNNTGISEESNYSQEESTDIPTKTVYVLNAGSYVVGIDIPVGRAKVTPVSGQGNVMASDFDGLNMLNAIVMTDSNGEASMSSLFESYSFKQDAYLYISQTAVIQLEFSSISKDCTGRKYNEQASYELPSGSYTVGIDIEPGAYKVVATSGMGNFIAGNYMEGGSNEMMGTDSETYSEEFGNIILEEGDTVLITMTLNLSFFKADK